MKEDGIQSLIDYILSIMLVSVCVAGTVIVFVMIPIMVIEWLDEHQSKGD